MAAPREPSALLSRNSSSSQFTDDDSSSDADSHGFGSESFCGREPSPPQFMPPRPSVFAAPTTLASLRIRSETDFLQSDPSDSHPQQ